MQFTKQSALIVSDFIACVVLAIASGLAISVVLAGAVMLLAGQPV